MIPSARIRYPRPALDVRPTARPVVVLRWSVVAVGLLGAGSCGGNNDAPRPNVLLISIDSTCQDLLGAYGRRPAHAPELSPSPRLDRLAEEGVLFEDASSTTSWTLPAHVSMLTGVPALVHGVDIDIQTPDPGLPNLAETLADVGYRTAGFYSGPYLDPRFGFARGFERYEACFGDELARATDAARRAQEAYERAELQGGATPELRRAYEESAGEVERLSHRDVSSASVTDAALEVLDQAADDDRPFFLFLHYFDAHYDYTPPAPYDTRFDAAYEGTIDGREFIVNSQISAPLEGDPFRVRRVISDRDLEHIFALYEGELAWTDEQIGRVLDRLDEHGLAEDTLVIVTSDHGDEFFEHDGLGHRKTLYEEVVQVPLILRFPGRFAAGRRVAQPTSILSIVPTVLEVCRADTDAPLVAPSLVDLAREGNARPSGEAPGHLARLVYTLPAAQGYTNPDGTRGSVPVLQVFLTETFRKGPIKIYRRRKWTEYKPDMSMPPEVKKSLADRQAGEKAVEYLKWIDLEIHPRESERYFSADFSDPRARAALDELQALYPRLLEERRSTGRADVSDMRGGLESLGYASGDVQEAMDTRSDRASEAFLAPTPGTTAEE